LHKNRSRNTPRAPYSPQPAFLHWKKLENMVIKIIQKIQNNIPAYKNPKILLN